MTTAKDASLLIPQLVAHISERCQKAGILLATAESCTGGMVAAAMTDLAGSSAWFERGFVTYSNPAKIEMLGVPAELIDQHGAVSEAVVRAMAEGALRMSHAHLALAITGIAGPTGGSDKQPVGAVWFAWSDKRRTITLAHRRCFEGNRAQIRLQASAHALRGVLTLIEHDS